MGKYVSMYGTVCGYKLIMKNFIFYIKIQPKFEKRWADRKSRVAQLEGFRFFTLLKRVAIPGISDYSKDGDFGNYVSLTVWENKDCFDAWRTGDAFKEAHGGMHV